MIGRANETSRNVFRGLGPGLGAMTLIVLACRCGGDGGPSIPELSCRDGNSSVASTVVLKCGGATSSEAEKIDVAVNGSSSGIGVRGFTFDVIYSPSKLEFVPATSYASPLLPDGLVGVTLSDGRPGRVVVSVQQVGDLPPVSVTKGQHTLLSLTFRRVPGATFDPTPLTFENFEAHPPSVGIGFRSDLSLSYE